MPEMTVQGHEIPGEALWTATNYMRCAQEFSRQEVMRVLVQHGVPWDTRDEHGHYQHIADRACDRLMQWHRKRGDLRYCGKGKWKWLRPQGQRG